MAMVAADALQSGMQILEWIGGQLDLIVRVIKQAVLLDTLADRYGNELSGVFLYDAAEPFRAFIAKWLTSGENLNLRHVVR